MRIALLLLLLVSAAGCGQKGALIAPAEPAPVVDTAAEEDAADDEKEDKDEDGRVRPARGG